MLIDMHCHLDYPGIYEEIETVVDNAVAKGLRTIVTSGIDPESNRTALRLAERYEIVRASLGLYPIDALRSEKALEGMKQGETDVERELAFIERNIESALAIGEIGLDYKTGSRKEEQRSLFRRQLELAERFRKPVVIHSRKAEADALEILGDFHVQVILHCFCGRKSLVRAAADKGYMFTVPTSVVRSQQFQELAKNVPLRQLFCETDSPFMSPYKDIRNEPAFVAAAYDKIAELRGMDSREVANIIYNNWQRVFR